MFFYTTSQKFKFKLSLCKLSENQQYLEQAAKWAEEKWGYIRKFPGIKKRKELISKLQDNFFIVTYGKQPVGMFALLDYHWPDWAKKKISAKELMYVYVDECFRGFGVGGKIIEIAKKTAKENGSDLIIFDTLNPNLNQFYEKHGAHVICEGQLLQQPTTVFRI